MGVDADKGTAAHQILEHCLIFTYDVGIPTYARESVGVEIEVRDTEHEDLSPSAADRWMTCHGSFQMQQPFREHPDPNNVRKIVFDNEYAEAVQEVLDYIERRVKELQEESGGKPVTVYAEHRVSPEAYIGTSVCAGTLDVALVAGEYVELIDAKFGAGVFVSAKTRQLDIYLLGFLADMGLSGQMKSAVLTIAQPRYKYGRNFDSRFVDLSGEWEQTFAQKLKSAVEATKQEPPILVPSEEACRFCLARGSCSAAMEAALNQVAVLDGHMPITAEAMYSAAEEFGALEPFTLTAKQVRGLLDGAAFLRGTLAAVEEYAFRRLTEGSAPPEIAEAYKLVHANSQRRWAHGPEETEKRLKRIKIQDSDSGKMRALGKKDIMTTNLASVAVVEKMLKRAGVPSSDARFDAFRALVTKPEGALTLTPISDPRPAAPAAASPQAILGKGPDIDAPQHSDLKGLE